jgi:hypothetical protein
LSPSAGDKKSDAETSLLFTAHFSSEIKARKDVKDISAHKVNGSEEIKAWGGLHGRKQII